MIELPPPLWMPPRPAIIRSGEIKKANFLPGMFPGAVAAGVTPASLTFIGQTELSTDLTTYSFATHAIGLAHPTRRVVVVAHWPHLSNTPVLNSATIGGNAAAVHASSNATSNGCGIFSLLVPTGTTATIAFTLSAGAQRARIAVYRGINETSATLTAFMVDNTISTLILSGTLNIAANGWVVAGMSHAPATASTGVTWTGVADQYDFLYTEAAGIRTSGGFQSGLPAETPRTITAVLAAGSNPAQGRLVAVSWA